MHRVAPTMRDTVRTIVCFSYAGIDELDRDVTHETMLHLYPGDADQ
jgi:hypothetical protein